MLRAVSAALLVSSSLLAPALSSGADRSLRLDELLEDASAWTLKPAEGVRVSVAEGLGHGTPRSLLIEWPKQLGAVRDGIPSAPQVPSVWIRLPAHLDLSRYTKLTFHARIEGPRHGFLHVVISSEPRTWGPDLVTQIGNAPLDAGGWRSSVLSLDLSPTDERLRMRWLGFASVNVGHLPDEPDWLRTWIDDVELSAEEPPPRSGWKADPSQVIVSRLGFRPQHEKLALVDGARAGARFELLRSGSDAVCHAGLLQLVESAVGRHAVADFTTFSTPGEYRVRTGELLSLPFRIGDDANEHSLDLLADWVHGMRCGQATALHSPCHLDDGLFLLPSGAAGGPMRRSLPLSGGWHDAGDVRTYYSYSYEMAWRWLRARDAGRLRDRDGDGVDDFLDGARWALAHAIRLVDPVHGGLLDKIDDRGDPRRGNYWSDNRRGDDDDRPVRVGAELPRHVASLAASAGLALRRATTEEDLRLGRSAVELAERRLAAWVERPPPVRPGLPAPPARPKVDDRHGHVLARFGLGALELHLATGKVEQLELARACANAVLALQSQSFVPGATREMGGDIFTWTLPHEDGDLPELFLAELLLELPEDPDAPRWRAALLRVADWWMKPSREPWAPFSLPTIVLGDKERSEATTAVRLAEPVGAWGGRWLVPSAGRQQLADTALAMQRVAQALADPELERLARRQLHWAFGFNPFGVAWVTAHDPLSIEQLYSFSQGRMPGAVAGYGLGREGEPRCFRPSGAEPVTHASAELLAAAVALTEPARFALVIVDAGRAWRGEAVVTWERTGEELMRLRTDPAGRLPELALDGGERYRLRLGDVQVELAAIGGCRIERRIDRSRLLSLRAEPNEPAVASRPFTIAVTARNEGLAPLSTTLRVHSEGTFTLLRASPLELAPGESKTVDWPLRAKSAGRPFIATFRADGTDALVDVGGAIRPAAPARSTR